MSAERRIKPTIRRRNYYDRIQHDDHQLSTRTKLLQSSMSRRRFQQRTRIETMMMFVIAYTATYVIIICNNGNVVSSFTSSPLHAASTTSSRIGGRQHPSSISRGIPGSSSSSSLSSLLLLSFNNNSNNKQVQYKCKNNRKRMVMTRSSPFLLHSAGKDEHESAVTPSTSLSGTTSGGGGGSTTPTTSSVSIGATGPISATTTAGAPPFSVTLDNAAAYSYKEALLRTAGWVSAAFIFGSGLWAFISPTMGEEFFAGYLVEQSLSIDNLFVFLLLFEYFQVPLQYQDRVLNWGIYGAIVMRAIMISLGVVALEHFRPILLVFAAILVYGSAKFFIGFGADSDHDEEEDPSQNQIVKFAHKLIQSTDQYDEDRFFTMKDGVRLATPLFVCMVALEISDIVFAVDSIPAVFGVTENPLVIFTSNMFAIMGLRSLYTILSKAAADLKYLEPAVAVVLGFIGSKMIAEYVGYDIPTNISLAVVATLLLGGIGASLVDKRNNPETGSGSN